MPRAGLSRRQLLKLGVTAAGATLAPGGAPARPRRAAAATGEEIDHARAAQQAYRRSLSRFRRSIPAADGSEVWEPGAGTLSSPPAALKASRNARAGRPDF